MLKFACPNHDELTHQGRSGLLDYFTSAILEHMEIYFDLDFYDTQIVKTGDNIVYAVLKKSYLYLPLSSASIQKFTLTARNNRASLEYELRANPPHYKGFPDCLNELGEINEIVRFVTDATRKHPMLGKSALEGPSEDHYVTIMENTKHYDIFLHNEGNEGRYSIDKDSGDIYGVMHTHLRKTRKPAGLLTEMND